MKTYLKDLTPEEVIRRLKAGEVVRFEEADFYYRFINDVLCFFDGEDGIVYNASISIHPKSKHYFETPDELKLEVGKCYRTKDGRKAFISSYNSSTKYFKGAVIDFLNLAVWTENGMYLYASEESNLDLISEWSDDHD